MKVTIAPSIKPNKCYPCLMRYLDDKMVVLVTKEHSDSIDGIVLDKGDNKDRQIGDDFDGWTKEKLEDFNGTITLENS